MNNSNLTYANEQPLLDVQHLQMLEELSDSDESLVKELAHIFKSSTPELLKQLSAAMSADDRESVRRLAHRLKGSAANIGAKQMAAHCSYLEQQARNPEAEISSSDLNIINDNFAASEQALSHWLSKH